MKIKLKIGDVKDLASLYKKKVTIISRAFYDEEDAFLIGMSGIIQKKTEGFGGIIGVKFPKNSICAWTNLSEDYVIEIHS